MKIGRSWKQFPTSFRKNEIQQLLKWVKAGTSGAIIGLTGAGKSNLLGYLCHRQDVIQSYLSPLEKPVILLPIDLNNIPNRNLSTIYRVILRSFFESRTHFTTAVQSQITDLYRSNKQQRDAFVVQSALRELLYSCQNHYSRVVFVFDRFDDFCQIAGTTATNTLRGLRDSFKSSLLFLVSMRHEIAYLPESINLGELRELLDMHVCWVGPMAEADALDMIERELRYLPVQPTSGQIEELLLLTGGYPALLKAACQWFVRRGRKIELNWLFFLSQEPSVQHRLAEIWQGLTRAEQTLLQTVTTQLPVNTAFQTEAQAMQWQQQTEKTEQQLLQKGLLRQQNGRFHLFSSLFEQFVKNQAPLTNGRIWHDAQSDTFFSDQYPIRNLSPLEHRLLHFFVHNPLKGHPKTDIILSAWPLELRKNGVTDESLYRHISNLRQKIEPTPTKPSYIITWRSQPEGGYRFFPDGRPN